MNIHDNLVVGSGCSGAIATETLVEKGINVTMLDVGTTPKESHDIPNKDFISIRRDEADQYKYLIGENAEGVSWGKVGKGEQITPPRKHLLDLAERYIPVESSTFSPVESLGYGGLGISWGLQCWEYSTSDMRKAGLDPVRMAKAYEEVAQRIGISASKDDAYKYTLGTLKNFQASPSMDRNHRLISQKYAAQRDTFHGKGMYLGRTPLALITEDFNGRTGYSYKDMDFYSDNEQSAWRPWITIEALKKRKNFNYISGYLVMSVAEKKDYVEITSLNVATNEQVKFYCRTLILGTGALNTARIALRSWGNQNSRVPILCNPYTYVPCLQPRLIGKDVEKGKLGFTQLSLFLDESKKNSEASVASLYSYQSLMLFRIIRHAPLNFVDARILMRHLMSGLVIMGIHHPDKVTDKKYVELKSDNTLPTGDKLAITYSLEEQEKAEFRQREKKLIRAMRSLGTFGTKIIDPGFGASIHYAGTLPFSSGDSTEFTLSREGRLNGTRNIYVADSSGFNYLPAPGLTFSLMANARIVAENAIKKG